MKKSEFNMTMKKQYVNYGETNTEEMMQLGGRIVNQVSSMSKQKVSNEHEYLRTEESNKQ